MVGPAEVKARRPGWNQIRLGGDRGPYSPVEDAAGNPIFPVAYLDPAAVEVARVDRSEWPDDADACPVLGSICCPAEFTPRVLIPAEYLFTRPHHGTPT